MLVYQNISVAYQDSLRHFQHFFLQMVSDAELCSMQRPAWFLKALCKPQRLGSSLISHCVCRGCLPLVSLVNSHGLFAFYPVLTPSLLSLKKAKVSVLVDLQRENRIPKGLETRQQINTASTDYSLRFYYFKGSLLTFRAWFVASEL